MTGRNGTHDAYNGESNGRELGLSMVNIKCIETLPISSVIPAINTVPHRNIPWMFKPDITLIDL